MKLLVIGGSGFVGRHLLAEAARCGIPAAGSTTRQPPAPGLFRFDLADGRPVAAAAPPGFFRDGPVWVVVAASTTPMDRCRTEGEYARRVNVTNTIRLIDEAAAMGARVAFLSSSYVFDGATGYYPENWPQAPVNAYGEQKSAVDRYVTAHHPDGLVLRLGWVVGADPTEAHPLTDWWRQAAAGKPVVCIADQLMSPVLVDDVARGIVAACRLGLCGAYHLAGPEFAPRADLGREFLRVMGRGEVVERPLAAFGFAEPRPLNNHLDPRRFAAATGLRFTPMSTVMARFRDAADRVAPPVPRVA